MRRGSAIIFLILYMLSATETDELLKLPTLFAHYTQHTHEHSLGFTDYLINHYATPGTDNSSEKQLPFHNTDTHSFLFLFYPLRTIFLVEKNVFLLLQKDFFVPTSCILPCRFSRSVWQPPWA